MVPVVPCGNADLPMNRVTTAKRNVTAPFIAPLLGPGFPFRLPGRLRLYTQPPLWQPFLNPFDPELLRRPRKGQRCLLRARKNPEVPHFKQFQPVRMVKWLASDG